MNLSDWRDVVILVLGGAVLCVLAVSGAVSKDVAQNGLLVYLGIIGGAVTVTPRTPAVPKAPAG